MRKVGIEAIELGSDLCRHISDPSKTIHLLDTVVLNSTAHAQCRVLVCSALIGSFARHFQREDGLSSSPVLC